MLDLLASFSGGGFRCAGARLGLLPLLGPMSPSYSTSPVARSRPGIWCAAPASSWPSPLGSARTPSPAKCSATLLPSGAPAAVTRNGAYRASWSAPAGRGDLPGFPPLQRAQIVQLACLEPVAKGLHITHWSSADLAREAVAEGIVPAIGARSVRRILSEVDLQPHRTRFWKTAALNAQFLERAVRVLWCYNYAGSLARRGFWVVCADELPNFQVLERRPTRRAIPGSIEQREFEYTRHGTLNVLVFLVVHTGRMEAVCLDTKDAGHYIRALRHFRRRHRGLKGVYLIHDGDGSHTAFDTQDYLHHCGKWWRPCPTPAHASWLNQAELLLDAFELRYLKRGSWASREECEGHIAVSWPEYNSRYAHPFDWEWSIPKMRQWFAEHSS
jgi:hypothetical protein